MRFLGGPATSRTRVSRGGPASAPKIGRPAVSVIVTNHNYGHFLDACLGSALGQTHPPHEVIVVNDHCSDFSALALERHNDRITVLEASARGQGAAFNLGFAQASGEIIAFLDADDTLHPEALETALAYWSGDLALLAFGLETMDAAGRSTGVHPYSLAADDGDNRPRLLRNRSVRGPFLFAPTSGNLFSRAFLEAALPIPEMEWHICADAYLVRAAALWGRSRAITRVLGRYRVHGGNNYIRPDTFDPWSMQRSIRDLEGSARALEGLAAWGGVPETGVERETLRTALRLRALETRANAAAWTGDRAAFRRRVGVAARATLAARGAPLAERIAVAASMLHFGRRALRPYPVDLSHANSPDFPRLLPRLPGAGGLAGRLRELERPRWHTSLRYGVTYDFREHGPHLNVLADGWCGRRQDGVSESSGPEAALEFALEPTDRLVAVEMVLAAMPGFDGGDLGVSVSAGGERAWVGILAGDGDGQSIRFTIDRDPFDPQDPQRIEICCRPVTPRRRLSLARRPAPCFRLLSLRVDEAPPSAPEVALRPGVAQAMDAFVRTDPGCDWLPEADGSARMATETARLALAFAPGTRRFDLGMRLCDDLPEGWLHLRVGEVDLFTGRPRSGSELRLRLPEIPAHLGGRALEIDVRFGPDAPDPGHRFGIAEVTLIDRGEGSGPHGAELFGAGLQTLNPGQTVFLASGHAAADFLVAGWDGPDESGARNVTAEAALGFALPAGMPDPVLRLRLRPLFAPPAGMRHVIGFAGDGGLLQAAELQGEGEIAISLLPAMADRRDVEITLHSAYAAAEPTAAAPEAPVLALFELVSLSLDGMPPAAPPAPSVVPARESATDLVALVDLARRVDLRETADHLVLLALRARLAAALDGADDRALRMVAAMPGALAALEALGGGLLAAPLSAGEAAVVGTAASRSDRGPSDRLRGLLLSFLLLPAFRSGAAYDLASTPAILLRDPRALAAYLGREPEFGGEGDAPAYVAWLEGLLSELDGCYAARRRAARFTGSPSRPSGGFAAPRCSSRART